MLDLDALKRAVIATVTKSPGLWQLALAFLVGTAWGGLLTVTVAMCFMSPSESEEKEPCDRREE